MPYSPKFCLIFLLLSLPLCSQEAPSMRAARTRHHPDYVVCAAAAGGEAKDERMDAQSAGVVAGILLAGR
jgi:hypothetical protein